MTVLALDPGNTRSALVAINDAGWVIKSWLEPNETIRQVLFDASILPPSSATLVIEQVQSYGMAVGAEVFETVFWSGRFAEAWCGAWHRLPRRSVKLHLCGQARAKDQNVRQAVIDRYGGKENAIGRKANPGPLYGIKADLWQALALGICWQDGVRP